MVAHKLAQFAKSNLCSHVWKGVTPPFVSHLIVSDLEPHAGGSVVALFWFNEFIFLSKKIK